ncbi:alpha/beta-hydrolase, partial [Coprinopsis marcescibilis]
NYDFPNNCEDYVHRIGRTGRAGLKGVSYTYFTTDNAKSARELIGILREAKAPVPPQLEEMGMYGGGGGRSEFFFPSHKPYQSLTIFVGRYGGGGRGRGGGGGGGYGRGGGGGGYSRNNDRCVIYGKKDVHAIGGLEVTVYHLAAPVLNPSVGVLFLLHGREGSKDDLDKVAVQMTDLSLNEPRSLIVVTLDHRNHGKRTVDPKANLAWSKNEDKHNPQHAVCPIADIARQVGTVRDVSFLIDFLPSYLFPQGDRRVEVWGVAGVSLGGHSTWLALCHDPRITVGIPIIGCPDYLALMKHRTETSGVPMDAPFIPASLVETVQRNDPVFKRYSSEDGENPFLGKKILVMGGEVDRLVPWTASAEFVSKLVVGGGGSKRVEIFGGVGHSFVGEMKSALYEFVRETMLISQLG